MSEPLKLPKLVRDLEDCEISIRKADSGTSLTFPVSSGYPVERFFGNEVLSHSKGSIRMDRVQRGAMPLLFNHNWDDPIGMVSAARVESGRLVVDANLFATERAKEVASMMDGGLKNVSLGYRIYEVEEDKKTATSTVTDWEPFEVSIVSVPADPTVGLGRASSGEEIEVRVIHKGDSAVEVNVEKSVLNQPANTADRSMQMSNTDNAAAGKIAEGDNDVRVEAVRNSANELEAGRIAGIRSLCKTCKIDERTSQMWVSGGTPLSEVAEDINKIVQQREANNPKAPSRLGLSDNDAKRFSFARALIAASTNNWADAGFELECSRAIYQKTGKPIEANRFCIPLEVQEIDRSQGRRDLTVGTTTAGGFLVGTQNQSFIDLLRNRTVAYRMGVQRLPGLVGNVTIPKQTGAATPVWLANEASTITESAQTFGQLALTPKTVGAYVEISRQLLLQSQPAAEQIAMSDVAAVAGIAVDTAVLTGSGASGQPTGITNTAGIGAFTGTSLASAGVLDAQSDVISANVFPVAPGYVTTAAVAALLMARPELPSTGTTRLWKGNMMEGSIFDFPAMSSAQMAAATMLFGDWSRVVVGEWGALEIETNPYANFQAGIIGIRALITIDVGVRYAAAFSLASSIT